jgi:hypothetical protein
MASDARRCNGTRPVRPSRIPFLRGELGGGAVPDPSEGVAPATCGHQLMARFDDWVTDPSVTRAGLEEFVANLKNVGRDFLGR